MRRITSNMPSGVRVSIGSPQIRLAVAESMRESARDTLRTRVDSDLAHVLTTSSAGITLICPFDLYCPCMATPVLMIHSVYTHTRWCAPVCTRITVDHTLNTPYAFHAQLG